jgi:uncharacterized membrane protein (DUF485 family)
MLKLDIIRFFQFLDPFYSLFWPYFFISSSYLYSSINLNDLHRLDSFYSGKQSRVDWIYYLIQTLLPMGKISNLWQIVQSEKKVLEKRRSGFSESFSQAQLFFYVSLLCLVAESYNQEFVSVNLHSSKSFLYSTDVLDCGYLLHSFTSYYLYRLPRWVIWFSSLSRIPITLSTLFDIQYSLQLLQSVELLHSLD